MQSNKTKPVQNSTHQNKTATHNVQPKQTQSQSTKKPVQGHSSNVQNQQNAKTQNPSQNKPTSNQQQKQVQEEHKQQIPVEVKPPRLELSQTIKLTQLLQVMDQDREDKKITLFIDETGNAYNFFKYKGTIVDISKHVLDEQMQGKSRSDNQEIVRKTIISALKSYSKLVISEDLIQISLFEFFKDNKFFDRLKEFFDYNNITNEDFLRQTILKPEEDVDNFGNKGFFMSKKQEFQLCLLVKTENDESRDPEVILEKFGLADLRDKFRATKIE